MDSLFNMAVIISAIDRASAPIVRVAAAMGDLGDRARSLQDVGQRMTVAGALTQGAADQMTGALGRIVGPAVQFESAMADVGKVVDFEAPDGLARMGEDILAMSTRIPIAAGGLADIMAAAGQSGIAAGDLRRFAEEAAKMGVAFDLSGAEAGAMMANWRGALGLSQDRTVALADAANHLSNNMNATATAIGVVIQRQGAVAQAAGLAEVETAALAAALLSSGTSPEIAATALKNLTGALTQGEAATGAQRAALERLGFGAEQMARLMQDDAQGAIVSVFQALAQQPAEARGSLASMLFGDESKGAIMPLLTNMDNLHQAFGLVADGAEYAGSMQAEYETRSATTEAQMQRMSNIMERLAVTMGSLVLPAFNDGLLVLQRLGNAVTDFAAAHPALFRVALGFAGILAVALAVVAPILSVVGGLVMMGSYGLAGVVKLAGGMAWLRRSTLGALVRMRALAAQVMAFAARAAARFWFAATAMARSLMAQTVPAIGATLRRMAALSVAALRFSARGAVGFVASAGRMAVALAAGLVPALAAAATGAAAFAATLLANPLTWIVLAIGAAALLVYRYWDPIQAFFEGLWSGIQAAFEPVAAALAQAFEPVAGLFEAAFAPVAPVIDVVSAALGRVVGWVRGLITPAEYAQAELDGVRAVGEALGVALGGTLVGGLNAVLGAFQAVGGAVDALFGGLSAIGAWLSGQWRGILAAFDEGLVAGLAAVFAAINPVGWISAGIGALLEYLAGVDLASVGLSMIEGLRDGILGGLALVTDAVASIAGSVVDEFRSWLGISSPSTVFAEFGGWIMDGLREGLLAKISAVTDTVGSIAGSVVDEFKSWLGISSPSRVFAGFGGDVVAGLAGGVRDNEGLAVDRVAGMSQAVRVAAVGAIAGALGSAPAIAAPDLMGVPVTIPAPIVPAVAPEISARPPAPAGGPVHLTLQVTVQGDATRETVQDLEAALSQWVRSNGRELADAVGREVERRGRMDFGGG